MMTTILKGWTPFEPAAFNNDMQPSEIAAMAFRFALPEDDVHKVLDDIRLRDAVFLNSRYQVNVRPFRSPDAAWPEMIVLSIKRRDKQRVGEERYRDFLRIKNELVGPLHEAIELYPAMTRNVDTANQYYVWVLADPDVRFPFGFKDGKMLDNTEGTGATQHPFEEGDQQ